MKSFILFLALLPLVCGQSCQAERDALDACLNKPQLWYFNIQGKAEPIRMMLEDAGVDYEWVPVSKTDGQWNQVEGKPRIPELFPFGQVPFYADRDIKIAQSQTISRYLAKKHGFYGRTEIENAQIDQMADGVNDLLTKMTPVFYASDEEQAKKLAQFRETDGPRWVGVWNKHLDGVEYLVSNTISYADYALYHIMTLVPLLDGGLRGQFPNIEAFMKRMEARPRLAAYLNSETRPPAYYKKIGN
eukprot:TRINITY_DN78238_c0_g1_i1.p1 TRINITY_DN78238_c0_g1~~TRINITY_DN78238_c0_g1_i1.p1  ORF type:complete len:245 (+),score=34.88 TRINITY_DN78238_c0_g1_i1:82-816(+)